MGSTWAFFSLDGFMWVMRVQQTGYKVKDERDWVGTSLWIKLVIWVNQGYQ